MEELPCCHCGDFFPRSPRHKDQNYCKKPKCQKARKAAWKRNKMRIDPKFRADCHLANQKWSKATPGYWKEYRSRNPDKVERNRELQIIRNRRRKPKPEGRPPPAPPVIAKVDASISNKFNPVGAYYLVPVIAKVDALKVRIYEITEPYP